jgi:4a-hydroxytetrahydrobiopterin dehydratase
VGTPDYQPQERLIMKAIPNLTKKHCTPSEKNDRALTASQVKTYLAVVPEWILAADGKRIRRKWVAKDFLISLDFFNRVGQIAQAEDHHPDLHLRGFRNVTIELSTHDLDGLSENDFILAAKINQLSVELKK